MKRTRITIPSKYLFRHASLGISVLVFLFLFVVSANSIPPFQFLAPYSGIIPWIFAIQMVIYLALEWLNISAARSNTASRYSYDTRGIYKGNGLLLVDWEETYRVWVGREKITRVISEAKESYFTALTRNSWAGSIIERNPGEEKEMPAITARQKVGRMVVYTNTREGRMEIDTTSFPPALLLLKNRIRNIARYRNLEIAFEKENPNSASSEQVG